MRPGRSGRRIGHDSLGRRLSVRSAPSRPLKSTTATGRVDMPDISASLAAPANAIWR